MFIATNVKNHPAQFGRAELNLKSAARTRSARPNCAQRFLSLIYKHGTPDGVEIVLL
jgi:hypothetical protein